MTDSETRILLVEDDPVSAAFLQAALERVPARVDIAPTCGRARGLVRARAYALLVVDANLPDGRGDALLEDLRGAGSAAPALAHTASRERGDHEQLLAAGFLEVLVKPLSASEVLAAARAVLGLDGASVRPLTVTGDTPLWDDAAALDALLGDRSHLDALRRLFVLELRGMRVAVAAAVRTDDSVTLQAVLHRLRASCAFVGASRLCAAAEALARGVPANEWPAFESVLAETLDQAPVEGP